MIQNAFSARGEHGKHGQHGRTQLGTQLSFGWSQEFSVSESINWWCYMFLISCPIICVYRLCTYVIICLILYIIYYNIIYIYISIYIYLYIYIYIYALISSIQSPGIRFLWWDMSDMDSEVIQTVPLWHLPLQVGRCAKKYVTQPIVSYNNLIVFFQ